MESDQRLPNGEAAEVPPGKVEEYLLNSRHIQNKGKAQFYELAGYTSHPERLAEDLKMVARTGRVTATRITSRGTLYEVLGEVIAPNKRKYLLTTA